MAEGVPTNNQRGQISGPCRLWGVPTALFVRVQCFRQGLYKVVERPSTRPLAKTKSIIKIKQKVAYLNACNCSYNYAYLHDQIVPNLIPNNICKSKRRRRDVSNSIFQKRERFGGIYLNIRPHTSSKVGQDQVSRRVKAPVGMPNPLQMY